MRPTWYGQDPSWWLPMQAAAVSRYGRDLNISFRRGRIDYQVRVDVVGVPAKIPVLVQFFAQPTYDCYGLPPEDYPRIYADLEADSPHRMGDRALCLYKPTDPPERRWRSDDGLHTLLELARRHLFLEHGWRLTGATDGGVWAGDEAPHGTDIRRSA